MCSSTVTFLLVILQVSVVSLVFGAPACENVDCDSWKFKYKSCPVKMRIDDNAIVTVVNKRSVSDCTLGTSFGIRKNKVWVDKGCRAEFKVCQNPRNPNTIICEHDSATISCERQTIFIKSASYGRSTGPETCPHPQIKTTDCDAATSLRVVSDACNGKPTCTLTASNSVFGDPCVGTYKYLEVSYECRNKVCEPGRFYAAHAVCSKFYQCDEHGGVFVHDCPAGLLWNDKIQTCDWPKNVACGIFVPNPA